VAREQPDVPLRLKAKAINTSSSFFGSFRMSETQLWRLQTMPEAFEWGVEGLQPQLERNR
jgi:hypothetical protein